MVIEDSAHVSVPSSARATVAEVELYDFGRPAALSREHARMLALAFETFARQWAAQLSARIRGRAQVSLESVSMQTYDEYADSLPATTTMVVCALPDPAGSAVIQFPLSAAASWIVQMVGGRPTDTPEDRVLTPLEQALLRPLADEALENLTHALGGVVPARVSVTGIQFSSQFAQVASAGELVVVARFSLRQGGRTVEASVVLPAATVLDRLEPHGSSPSAATPGLMRRQVEEAPVELVLRLAPRTIRPGEVLDLAVGDVLTIPHAVDRPLDLVIGDQPVGAAAAGTSGARLACVITATVPDPQFAEESA
ncbi:flagellar motor switch protein FliM [Microbacterium sp. NPDC056044]|uniref:flagellar motor switch protein FliM n=1 Tax=Microbacterium sp. NPDC056044 TaxID=3345690 RepID=UPI0035DE4F24